MAANENIMKYVTKNTSEGMNGSRHRFRAFLAIRVCKSSMTTSPCRYRPTICKVPFTSAPFDTMSYSTSARSNLSVKEILPDAPAKDTDCSAFRTAVPFEGAPPATITLCTAKSNAHTAS